MRAAVVGHVEWVDFARVPRLPHPGEILHARETFAEAGGGGAVAAVQLVRLAGHCDFLTALGAGALGDRAHAGLRERGVDVHAVRRDAPQRRAFTFLDDDHERTITVMGPRCVPHRDDALPWERLRDADCVYFTGGDAAALHAARAARVLVATPRAREAIAAAGVCLDVLVHSGSDPGEQVGADELDPPPLHVVTTLGARGGRWRAADGRTGTWEAAALPGPPQDSYGAGDTFAAALSFGLAFYEGDLDAALGLAARCSAACLTGRGPYDAPLPRP